jgi:penicillin amidase
MRNLCCSICISALLVTASSHCAAAEETICQQRILAGLQDDVEIVIDRYGFPHIYAKNETDAMFALGYMHAGDRLWQMDYLRRAAQGRLSEITGPDALQHDTFVRTIGLNRLANAAAERAKNHHGLYENLRAYAWGVNSCIAGMMPDRLPVEFNAMGYQPEAWKVEDSLAIGKAMAWELSGSLDDLYLGTLVERLGWETVDELFPIDRYGEIPIIPTEGPEQKTADTQQARADLPDGIDEACVQILRMASRGLRLFGEDHSIGSNNWVIDGKKSASGRPMLASDPHLGLTLPSVWYAAHIKGGTLDVIGVSLPGVPMIAIGYNRHVAWGMTNTQADVTDFYIEELNAETTHYLHGGEWKPLEFVSETIKVRGREPQELVVPVTAHGPILSSDGPSLSIRWIGAEPDDDAFAFHLLNRAVDYDDFAAAMQTLNAPPQNFNYADTGGMIAMWVAGLFPVRKAGLGRVPMDGTSGDYDWKGFIPRIDTPHSVNPAYHYLASANQRPASRDYKYYLGYEWDPGYRARRINQLLASHDTITMDQMKSFQSDTCDTAADSMLPHLMAACKNEFEQNEPCERALEILSNWNFLTTADSPAPTIWWKWLDTFRDAVWQDEWRAAGIDLREEPWGHTDLNKWQPPLEVLERMVVTEPASKWFDDVSTEQTETLKEIASLSLRRAVDVLSSQLGKDLSEWNWGRTNRLRIDHLSRDPGLGRGGQPLSGSDLTLNARGNGTDVTGGPSWRMVVDLANLDTAVGVFPCGQSGDPQSPHYDDLLDKWIRNEYVPLLFYRTPEQFPEEQVEAKIRLSAPPAGENPFAP